MILSANEIQKQLGLGHIVIDPFDEKQLNPNSYNLKLANEVVYYKKHALDMKTKEEYVTEIIPEEGYFLVPGRLYLCRTVERTRTDKYVPMLEGRSSIGRLGIFIHATAGFGDIGFNGFWTLELSVVQPITIYPDIEICQIYFHTIEGEITKKYDSGKYQNNEGIQTSKLWQEL